MLRKLYILELVMGYVPLVLLWLVGILGLPIGFAMAFGGEAMGFSILLSVLLGAPGVWGAMQLAKKIIWPENEISISNYLKYLVFGCLASAIASIYFIGKFNIVATYLLASIIVTVHLYHVARKDS